MAISVLSQPDYLQPVYSIQEYELYDSANYAQAGFYYELTVTVGSESRTLKILKDENNKAVVDIQRILQPFVTSIYQNNYNLLWTSSGTTDYSVVAKSVWNTSSSTASTITKKVFNGVDHYNRTWDIADYSWNGDASGLFLTSYHGDREMHSDDRIYFNYIYGQSNGIDSSVNGFTFTAYKSNGDSSTYTKSWALGTDLVYIMGITIDGSTFNDESPGFWDDSVTSVTVTESTGLSETLRVNIVPIDKRFDRYYRIIYIDHFGCTEYQNFDLAAENDITISKTQYVNNRERKIFGTEVEDNYKVRTNWISCERSKALKDLWYSPKVGLMVEGAEPVNANSTIYPIIINDNAQSIKTRRSVNGMINYELNFSMSNEYGVQMQ